MTVAAELCHYWERSEQCPVGVAVVVLGVNEETCRGTGVSRVEVLPQLSVGVIAAHDGCHITWASSDLRRGLFLSQHLWDQVSLWEQALRSVVATPRGVALFGIPLALDAPPSVHWTSFWRRIPSRGRDLAPSPSPRCPMAVES